MKRLLITALSMGLFTVLTATGLAQGNPRGTTRLILKGSTISVEYGRPSLKGRSVDQLLGQLGENGVWRLGADKSTTFSTATDLAFDGVTIPKGEYSLWARRKSDKSWELVFNKQHGQWGTRHDASQDLAAVPLKEEKEAKSAEQVTITLENERGGGEISIQWGSMELTANFTAK